MAGHARHLKLGRPSFLWDDNRLTIDGSTDLSLADNRRVITGIGTSSPLQQMEIARGVLPPTLAADELMIYLCVHGASSAWFRLKWIANLGALPAGRQPDDIARLAEKRPGPGQVARSRRR